MNLENANLDQNFLYSSVSSSQKRPLSNADQPGFPNVKELVKLAWLASHHASNRTQIKNEQHKHYERRCNDKFSKVSTFSLSNFRALVIQQRDENLL